jgi:hypothetical protein
VAKAAGAPYPHGAVEDARERADSLAKLAASHAIEVSPSRVNDTAQHADAVEAMADVEPERWTPHRGDLDAQAGAHELGTLGGAHSPEEICAALAEAGAGSTAWLDRLRDQDMADAIKKAPRIARFTAPRSA